MGEAESIGWTGRVWRWVQRAAKVGELAVRLDEHERRIAELEAKLVEEVADPRERCLTCGEGRMALVSREGAFYRGRWTAVYRCNNENCGREYIRDETDVEH
ncbi:hypothetical protein [Euryhalocaulis caribicus]|uniref:hypothetical protein n=1 Tax=Euryhalocaulis caribicus TaxID=1161401 RepID=UPI0003B6433D|nr:hypothetical protein [Euryhalocaulis caribicus]